MKCPQCQSDVPESADRCFECGYVLRAQTSLIRGSMLAGRFEILAPLGRGGMGMVYKARDHKLEEVVAVKVLRPEIASDPEMERRFRKEIVLARKVRHRNVCGIHEYGDDGSLRFIAMEYIEGVDLRKLLVESGGLPLEEAFDTAIRTAEGLQAIHEAGIVHRDLKTANLMRDSHGVVRLMDFGIAKQVETSGAAGTATVTGLVMGTPDYMSPEQARAGKVDHRSDIYALGIVTFELFTGDVPFRGETPLDTIFKHLHEPPPLEGPGAEALPPSVVPVLRRALAKEQGGRHSSAAEFAMAMTQARDAAGVGPLSQRSSLQGFIAGARGARGAAAARQWPTQETVESTPTATRSGETFSSTVRSEPTREPAAPATRVADAPRGQGPGQREFAPPPRSGTRGTLVAVAAALLLAAAGGVALLNRPKDPLAPSLPATGPAPPSTAAAAASVAGPHGTLVIDAVPWGEVVAVVDASGRHHEPKGTQYTPLAIALPPGNYNVQVTNPGASEPLTRPATVRSETVERVSVAFRRVNAQEYLQKTGF